MLGVTADRQEDARGVRADTTSPYVKCKVLKELYSQPPPALSLAKPLDTTSTSLDPEAPLFTPTVSTSPDERKTVLLQTARSVMYNPSNPTASIEVRLLFDTGSQKSYITERARSLLSLEPCGEQPLSIATFGSAKEQMKVCPIVDVVEKWFAKVIYVVRRPNHLWAFG